MTGIHSLSAVHTDPGPSCEHCERFLEDGLGARLTQYHNALSDRGEQKGNYGRSVMI